MRWIYSYTVAFCLQTFWWCSWQKIKIRVWTDHNTQCLLECWCCLVLILSGIGLCNINFLNVVKFIWCSSKNVIFGPFLPSSLCGGSVCSWVQYLLNFTHFRCETFLLYGLKSIFNWVCVSFYPLPDLCSSTIICHFFFYHCLFNLFSHPMWLTKWCYMCATLYLIPHWNSTWLKATSSYRMRTNYKNTTHWSRMTIYLQIFRCVNTIGTDSFEKKTLLC